MARTEARDRAIAILGADLSAHDVASFDALTDLARRADNLRGRIACHGATAAIRAECWRFARLACIEVPRAAPAFARLEGIKEEASPIDFNTLNALVSRSMREAFEAVAKEEVK